MDRDQCVKCIVEGMELYLRTLARADCMHDQAGDIEWISPLPNAVGPAIVFKIALDQETAASKIDALLPGLQAGTVPSVWFVSPTSTPPNILEILLAKGFKDLSSPEQPELGMALDMQVVPEWPVPTPSVVVRKVQSPSEFSAWVGVVNEALHGWNMLSCEHYYPLVARAELSCYLAFLDGKPIATAATIQDGAQASLEFVSTLEAYRHRGAASAVCIAALRELQQGDVHIVTLRASHEAIPLYTRLGFKPYFQSTAVAYQK